MPLAIASWFLLPGTLDGFEPLCVLVVDVVEVVGEGLIIIAVDAIELVEFSTFGDDSRFFEPVGTEEYTVV